MADRQFRPLSELLSTPSKTLQACVKSLGEDATLGMLKDSLNHDTTPMCCQHCPYTDCSFYHTYDAVWLMQCSRYTEHKHTNQVEQKKLTVEDRIARIERLLALMSPFVRVYNPDDEIEYKKIMNELRKELGMEER